VSDWTPYIDGFRGIEQDEDRGLVLEWAGSGPGGDRTKRLPMDPATAEALAACIQHEIGTVVPTPNGEAFDG